VKREEVVPNILLGANQRLVSKICYACRVRVAGKPYWTANPKGCPQCRMGFERSRQVLFEYFLNTEAGTQVKLKRSIEQEVMDYAKEGVIDCDEMQNHCDLPGSGTIRQGIGE
jgi:type II secretory ATPase GspE/PulE/Tfp pilus assembly ATPase PilB-like protein